MSKSLHYLVKCRSRSLAVYNSPFSGKQKTFGEFWSTNKKVISAHVDLPKIDNVCAVQTNAFEFRPRDIPTRGMSTPQIFPSPTYGS